MTNRLPALAWLLGAGGLVPFLACGVGAVAMHGEWERLALLGLIGYAACILSFLGAVHWGFALYAPSLPAEGGLQLAVVQAPGVLRARLGLGVLPALIGWAGLLVTFLGLPSAALGVLTAGFAATIIAEHRTHRRALLPPGYIWLRWVLSVVVLVVLVMVALARVTGQSINL